MHTSQDRKVKHIRRRVVAWQKKHKPCNEADWMHLLSCYTNGSHIHGFYQLFWPKLQSRMRLLWALALLCAFGVLIYITYLLAERHQRKQFHTIIDNSHWSIKNIAFPLIIVCNKNRLNWSRLPELSKRYNISDAQQSLLKRVLTAYDALSFARFNVFETLQDQPLHLLNHLNFTQIVSELAWRCDEMLDECSWQTQPWNCCDLFKPRRLTQGLCLAFNEFEQRASVETGRGTGIIVRLHLNEALHAPDNQEPKGFVLSIVEPNVWFDAPIFLIPDADTHIGIRAIYHYYDENTYALHSLQRQCLLDDKDDINHLLNLQGYKYMLENCLAECQQLYMLRYCNCTLDLFYPPSQHVACQLKDLPCLASHNHLLQNYEQPGEHPYVSQSELGLICDCIHNCKSLTLLTDVRKKVLRPWQTGQGSVNASLRSENRSMLLNIYYKRNFILVYKTSLIYSWMDLMVSFGAVCQLCLGCSIISLLELLYFGLIDVPYFCYARYALSRLS